jgi:DNA-binding beta-propeller fold protein YncE
MNRTIMVAAGAPAALAIRAVMACLVIAGAWLAFAGRAEAAPGDLAYAGCLANDPSQGCIDLPFAPLDFAYDVAVSPDGKSVYVASHFGDSVAHFFRGPGGQLSYDGCLANDASQGCVDLPGAPLDGADGVAVSPDGKSVYVASLLSNSVSHFFRGGPDGQISYDGCLANDASQGCFDLPGDPLTGARDVAASADGKSVYVVSSGADSVAHFFRGGPDGQISYDGCVANTPDQGCADIPEAPIADPSGVTVSPDGRSVYVTALTGNAVAHLFRGGPDGQISWDGCVNNDGSQNCADAPAAPLTGASGVAVSPDGRSVYVTNEGFGGVAHLFRGPGGQISWDGCLNDDGLENCADLPGQPLLATRGVAVSPDGSSVYVASFGRDAIGHFLRGGPDGQITWGGCLAGTNQGGCADLPASPIGGASDVAVSADGRSVYVAAAQSDALAHFSREPVPGPTPTTPTTPDPAADMVAPRISGLTLTNRRFRARSGATRRSASRVPVGTKFRYRLSEAATVRVVIQRVLRARRVPIRPALAKAGRAGPNTLAFAGRLGGRRLRPGVYRARFTATDRSGNRSRPRSIRFVITTTSRKGATR